ncbi:hypothetical protein FQA39_LY06555 [Lamprigera yunnana]|nr:hypothetical protein FQA39_LY06555 [Lamprigera yunnana]
MVWEQNTKAVLMLNKLVEKKQEKCCQYWPIKMGADYVMKLDDVGLTLEYLEQQDHSYYLTRLLRLTDIKSGDSRDIIQFHYTTWPDFGVPNSPTAFLEFLRKVQAAGFLESSVGPAIVHCSAGIGRSGTFCLVDSCLILIENFGLNSVDVKDILLEMRRYRMGLIQTAEQLKFSYQAIIEGAKQLSKSTVNSENRNLDVSGIIEINNVSDNCIHSSDEDEPPPLPPPRLDSLNRTSYEGPPVNRPLPVIPNSASISDFNYDDGDITDELQSPPSGPLPVLPGEDEESSADELEDESVRTSSPVSDKSDTVNGHHDSLSPQAELRQRKRIERKEQLSERVRDMKRRQMANEQWTQLKRSLFKPLAIAGVLAVGGGILAFYTFIVILIVQVVIHVDVNECRQYTFLNVPSRSKALLLKTRNIVKREAINKETSVMTDEPELFQILPAEDIKVYPKSVHRNDRTLLELKYILAEILKKLNKMEANSVENQILQPISTFYINTKKVTTTEGPMLSCNKRHMVPRWSDWTSWSSCSVSCGKGRKIQWRQCLSNCDTAQTEMKEKSCQLPACSPTGLFGFKF